jgi:hypothetical protein
MPIGKDGMTPSEKINALVNIARIMKDVQIQKETQKDRIRVTFTVWR